MKYIVVVAVIMAFGIIVLMADCLGIMFLVWAALGGILLGGFGFLILMVLGTLNKSATLEPQIQRSPTLRRQQALPEPQKQPKWLHLLNLLDHLRK